MAWIDTGFGWSYNNETGEISQGGSPAQYGQQFRLGDQDVQGRLQKQRGDYSGNQEWGDPYFLDTAGTRFGVDPNSQALADWQAMMEGRQIASQAPNPQYGLSQMFQQNLPIASLINAGVVNPQTQVPWGDGNIGQYTASRQAEAEGGERFRNQFLPAAATMIGAAAAGGAFSGEAGATTGAATGTGSYSTPATTTYGAGGQAISSTPAMYNAGGVTGAIQGGTPVATMGAGAAAAAGTSLNTQGYTSPSQQVQTQPINTTGAEYTVDPYSPEFTQPPTNTGGPAGGGYEGQPQPTSGSGGPPQSGWEQWGNRLSSLAPAIPLLGGLAQMSIAEDMEDQTNKTLTDAQAQQQDPYPYEVNWDMVDQYLRDPMAILRNNPGYLASVDYLTKQGERTSAKQGYNVSGNKHYYLADVLGKNANTWYENAWKPIRDAAGLLNPSDPSRLAQVQTNAMGQIANTRSNAVQNLFGGGTMALQTLPDIFKAWKTT